MINYKQRQFKLEGLLLMSFTLKSFVLPRFLFYGSKFSWHLMQCNETKWKKPQSFGYFFVGHWNAVKMATCRWCAWPHLILRPEHPWVYRWVQLYLTLAHYGLKKMSTALVRKSECCSLSCSLVSKVNNLRFHSSYWMDGRVQWKKAI